MLPPEISFQDLRNLLQTASIKTIQNLYPMLTNEDFIAAEDLAESEQVSEPIAPTEVAPQTTASPQLTVPQPDVNGEFATPADGAKFMASLGVPQIPLKGKAPVINDWPEKATTDFAQIDEWYRLHQCNFGGVAYAKEGGHGIFEADSSAVRGRYNSEAHEDFANTVTVISTQNDAENVHKGHRYYQHTAASIALGNVKQDDKNQFSFRANNQYCVSPGSVHPKTGRQYRVASAFGFDFAPIPGTMVQWLQGYKTAIEQKETPKKQSNEGAAIPCVKDGGRNNYLFDVAIKWRHSGIEPEDIESLLLKENQKMCDPPLGEEEVKATAASACSYKGDLAVKVFSSAQPTPPAAPEPPIKIPTIPYPKFPEFVMEGTSIYEGYIKPYCTINCRQPEFMFVPLLVLILNYLGTRVSIRETGDVIPSLYLALVAKRGRGFKGSSIKDGIKLLRSAGLMDYHSVGMPNADAKALVFEAGSFEGMGLEANRLNCNNIVLFYEEFHSLVQKASIEGSSLVPNLLKAYESAAIGNSVKSRKESYALKDDGYCLSLIVCDTVKNFPEHWAKFNGRVGSKDGGMDDRTVILFQPETWKEKTVPRSLTNNELEATGMTVRRQTSAAMSQCVFSIRNEAPLQEFFKRNSNRAGIRVVKLALGIAILMGKTEIDEEAVRRALALGEYFKAVKRYLHLFDAETREASIQMKITGYLLRHDAKAEKRDLEKGLNASRYGTFLWGSAYKGLLQAGWIREEGDGSPKDPICVVLLRSPAEEDNDDDEDEQSERVST